MTRGERGGIVGEKGEGFTGTIIKDTWTITTAGRNGKEVGRGEGERQKTVLEQ